MELPGQLKISGLSYNRKIPKFLYNFLVNWMRAKPKYETYNLIRGRDVRGKYDEQPGTKTKTSPRTKTKPYIREGTHEY